LLVHRFGLKPKKCHKIISEDDGNPLSDVNITVKEKTIGTNTNANGEFSIDASQQEKDI
jgi:hypothetical protein